MCSFSAPGTALGNSLSDGVVSLNCFTVSNGVKQGGILSPHLFNIFMNDISVNVNKLQIGCVYAGTIMNHMMYADDICVFSPSVSGLGKLTDCCAETSNMFDITYNAYKSFCVVTDNKLEDKKIFTLLLSITMKEKEKCKYLGHIINNNFTDDIARQKICIYAQANVLARKFNLCNITIKTTLFNSYCGLMYISSLLCKLKKNRI